MFSPLSYGWPENTEAGLIFHQIDAFSLGFIPNFQAKRVWSYAICLGKLENLN